MPGNFRLGGLPSLLSIALENSPTGIAIADADGLIRFVNAAFLDLLALSDAAEAIGKPLLSQVDHLGTETAIRDCLTRTGTWSGDAFIKRAGGGKTPLFLSLSQDNTVSPTCLILWASEKSLSQALHKVFADERAIFEDGPVVAFVWDVPRGDNVQPTVRFVSRNVTKLGLVPEEVLGRSMAEFIHPDDLVRIEAANASAIAAGLTDPTAPKFIEYDYRLLRPDGTTLWVHDYTQAIFEGETLIGACGYLSNIDNQKRTESLLLRSQRLESLGVLAAGIAHDFNNLLTGVWGHMELARLDLPSGSLAAWELENAFRAFESIRGLTSKLLTFAKGGRPVSAPVNIVDLLHEVCDLHLSGANVDVAFEAPKDAWNAVGDTDQLAQLFSNLVVNAKQAMQSRGQLIIKTANTKLAAADAGPLAPGPYVRVTVVDTGPGIDKQHIEHIFDPFFSTKVDGTGIGLSSAHLIAVRHAGSIEVQSPISEGHGTCFTVLLPAIDQPAPAPRERPSKGSTMPTRRLKVLVMDDDRVARDVTEKMLVLMGHEVKVCDEGDDALALAAAALSKRAAFDVALLDLTNKKGRGGADIVAEFRACSRTTSLLACSGYSDRPIVQAPRDHGFDASLAKPFRLESLAKALAEATSGKENQVRLA